MKKKKKSVAVVTDMDGSLFITMTPTYVHHVVEQDTLFQATGDKIVKRKLKKDKKMIFDINYAVLVDNNINAHQFIICYLISKGNIEYLQNYLKKTNSEETIYKDLAYLVLHGFIEDGNYDTSKAINYLAITVKHNFNKLIAHGDFFDELVLKFPFMINRPDGTQDFLRTNLKSSRLYYNNLTKNNKGVHDIIMKCLDYEIKEKQRTGKMGYFRRLPKWLEVEEFKNYEHLVLGLNSIETKEVYGTELE